MIGWQESLEVFRKGSEDRIDGQDLISVEGVIRKMQRFIQNAKKAGVSGFFLSVLMIHC